MARFVKLPFPHDHSAGAPLGSFLGVGPRIAEKLAAGGLASVQDLWWHLPRQYEDRTALVPIRDLQPGVAAQVEGTVAAVERGFRYRPMLRVAIVDDSRDRKSTRLNSSH